jgi:ParB family transcriptional regulator, chromosome partitioning protein
MMTMTVLPTAADQNLTCGLDEPSVTVLAEVSLPELHGPTLAEGHEPPPLRAEYLNPRTLLDNPRNLRTAIGDLTDLKASMQVLGILCPLVIIPTGEDDERFQIIIGHRRKYAAIDLNMPLVPCIVAPDEGAAAQIVAQLAENGHRVGLSATEEAEAYHQLTLLDWSPEQIAKVRAIPTGQVRQTLRLRGLPDAAVTPPTRGRSRSTTPPRWPSSPTTRPRSAGS